MPFAGLQAKWPTKVVVPAGKVAIVAHKTEFIPAETPDGEPQPRMFRFEAGTHNLPPQTMLVRLEEADGVQK